VKRTYKVRGNNEVEAQQMAFLRNHQNSFQKELPS
jgi:hypothetical protein